MYFPLPPTYNNKSSIKLVRQQTFVKTYHNLTSNGNFFAVLIAQWTLALLGVIKVERYRRFGYTGLSTFVNQILQVLRANLKIVKFKRLCEFIVDI